jgi:hypothetical protein
MTPESRKAIASCLLIILTMLALAIIILGTTEVIHPGWLLTLVPVLGIMLLSRGHTD